MRQWVIGAVLLMAASIAPAAEKYVVALVDIECQACAALYAQTDALERAAQDAGFAFRYAPVPQSADPETAWAERAFYFTRDSVGEDWAESVLTALFAHQELKSGALTGAESVEAWLSLQAPAVNWGKLMGDMGMKGGGVQQTRKAIALFAYSGSKNFPAFVSVKDGRYDAIPASGDVTAKVSALKEWLVNQSQEKTKDGKAK